MILASFLLDLVAAGNVYLLSRSTGNSAAILPFIIQIVLTIIQIVLVFRYNGKRQTWIGPEGIGPQMTMGFAFVIISMLVNIVLTVMAGMRVFGKA